MRFRLILLILLPFFGFGQEVKMNDAEVKSFKASVTQASKETQTLSADFVQTKHMSFLAKPIESKGKLSFKKTGWVVWKYTSPFEYSVIFRDNKIYINDAGKKSDLGNNKMFDKLNKLIVGSISGDMFDEKEFTISYFKVNGKLTAKFLSKDATLKKYLKQIELTFDANHSVSEVKMIEPNDDYTLILLKNKKLNATIDNAVFKP